MADTLEETGGGLDDPASATFFLLALADRLLERGVGDTAIHALFKGTAQMIGDRIAADSTPPSEMN